MERISPLVLTVELPAMIVLLLQKTARGRRKKERKEQNVKVVTGKGLKQHIQTKMDAHNLKI